jgi:hypothetical protein
MNECSETNKEWAVDKKLQPCVSLSASGFEAKPPKVIF